jgi:uncharacterized protein YndB with AHSA1/START domain
MTAVATAEVVVDASPEQAFALFTEEIGMWWRRDSPYWNDPERAASILIEPRVGGRFVEVHDPETREGFEIGHVTAWEPGRRLGLTWRQADWPDGASTDVEVRFEAAGAGTRVRLEHSGFELVPGAEAFVGGYDAGWKEIAGWFEAHARREAA